MAGRDINALLEKLSKSRPRSPHIDLSSTFVPTTVDEFLQFYHFSEWPVLDTAECLIDLTDDRKLLGSKKQLHTFLKDATPVDMKLVMDLEDRLTDFRGRLHHISSQILRTRNLDLDRPPAIESLTEDDLTEHPETFITEQHDAKLVPETGSKFLHKLSLRRSSQKKTVESCVFPGFVEAELTELPGQMEAPQILHRVTKAQDFNAGFKKFWKRMFQSEASVAMMQDGFWWFFIDNFRPSERDAQDRFFDRIADTFVALFTTVNREIKDKIFTAYADCLAQAIVAAFRQAFPESDRRFNSQFKQKVVNTLSEWISGVPPPPCTWMKWKMKRLEPRVFHQGLEDGSADDSAATSTSKASLEMSEFKRMIQNLGEHGPAALEPLHAPPTAQVATPDPATGVDLRLTPITPLLPTSRLALCGTPRLTPKESHAVDERVEFINSQFDLKGRSPLVAHFLSMRHLRALQDLEERVNWLRVTHEPSSTAQTYHNVITESLSKQKRLGMEFDKLNKQTSKEIAKIQRKTRDDSHMMEELQKHVTARDSHLDIQLLKQKIAESQLKTPRNPRNQEDKLTLPGNGKRSAE